VNTVMDPMHILGEYFTIGHDLFLFVALQFNNSQSSYLSPLCNLCSWKSSLNNRRINVKNKLVLLRTQVAFLKEVYLLQEILHRKDRRSGKGKVVPVL
jgi:hypothetical protein